MFRWHLVVFEWILGIKQSGTKTKMSLKPIVLFADSINAQIA
jgi:hypothetical protein